MQQKRQFEIPYNFDIQLIDFLKIYNDINIHCIYLPPFKEHYHSAKFYCEGVPGSMPKTLEEYEKHISYINKNFPNKLMLLLQQNNILLSEELLNYYIRLGFTKFCVGSIEQADIIRQKNINYEIIGSITMKINNEKLLENDYTSFNGFVLWFPFNRDIEAIKQLPQNFYYILLINCGCKTYCTGDHHWFAKSKDEELKVGTYYCPKRKDPSFKNSIFIPPEDLSFFDTYIKYYKLQGREYTTIKIINDIVRYNNENFIKESLLMRYYNPYIIYNIQ